MKKNLLISLNFILNVLLVNAQTPLTAPVAFKLSTFEWQHQISSGDGSYYLFDKNSGTYPFMISRGSTTQNFIGIGTIDPKARLDIQLGVLPGDALAIQKDSGPGIKFKGTNAIDLGLIEVVNSNQEMRFSNSTNGILTQKMLITSNGYVGIGTTNPQSLLAVKGTITAQEVNVTVTGWSDFVFAPTYTLPTLEDLEKYINTNKHLPDVPTEKVVKENGLNLGQNDAVLLQKVEELTLYLIELNKEVKSLQSENKELKEQNSEVKIENAELKRLNSKLLELEAKINQLNSKK